MVSSNDSADILKTMGLEYIQDLAKDRKIAIQTMGVTFTGIKNDLNRSNIITKVDDRQYVEDLLEQLRKETEKTVNSQLSRLTIKSFQWIKNVLASSDKIVTVTSKDTPDTDLADEMQTRIMELQELVKTKATDLSRSLHTQKLLDDQLKMKNNAIQDLEMKIQESERLLTQEKSRAETLAFQSESAQTQIAHLQTQLKEKTDQLKSASRSWQDEIAATQMNLIEKNAEITRLTQALKQKEQQVEQMEVTTSDDVSQAMMAWAQQYQELESSFEKTLTKTRQEYEDTWTKKLADQETALKTDQKELKDQLTELHYQLSSQEDRYKRELEEFKERNGELEAKNRALDEQTTELIEKIDSLTKEITDQKIAQDQLHRELEEAKKKGPDVALANVQKRSTELSNVNAYIDQILSLSNFSMISILLQMNGEMELDHLAKAVGMDKIVLENQLQPLYQRNLIEIRRDGKIIANIPV